MVKGNKHPELATQNKISDLDTTLNITLPTCSNYDPSALLFIALSFFIKKENLALLHLYSHKRVFILTYKMFLYV